MRGALLQSILIFLLLQLPSRLALLREPDEPRPAKVEAYQGRRQEGLRERVRGGREDGSGNDASHDDVPPGAEHGVRIHEPRLPKQDLDHRHLERQPGAQHEHQYEFKVLVDGPQALDRPVRVADEERQGRGGEHGVREEQAHVKEHRRPEDDWSKELPLRDREARKDERDDLVQDQGRPEEEAGVTRDLEGREEELSGGELKEFHAFVRDGRLQDFHELLRVREAADDSDADADDRHEDPLAQLVEVLPDGHLHVVRELLLVRKQKLLHCCLVFPLGEHGRPPLATLRQGELPVVLLDAFRGRARSRCHGNLLAVQALRLHGFLELRPLRQRNKLGRQGRGGRGGGLPLAPVPLRVVPHPRAHAHRPAVAPPPPPQPRTPSLGLPPRARDPAAPRGRGRRRR
mmetsp:Transcript_4597/g.13688  ORF Transcript_4597/g.13688 Transcript_4597/m.13688 type:complete len:403 (+) Transcript_4597:1181-2389(+)